MEKTIDLKNDAVFKRAVFMVENRNYTPPASDISADTRRKFKSVNTAINDLRRCGKLNKTDLKIIALRKLSPMPNYRAIEIELNIPRSTVCRRIKKIKDAIKISLKKR